MSSDSTNEDEYERIKEAVDENFLTNLFTNAAANKKFVNPLKSTSSRNQNHQKIFHNPFSVKVTPEFQRHVSKHLSRWLDEIIDDKEIIIKSKKRKKGHLNYGIKLLSSSKNYLLSSSNVEKNLKSKKLIVTENLYMNDYEKKAREVAVTPEWVISQEETRCWALNTKGGIEIVKPDDL